MYFFLSVFIISFVALSGMTGFRMWELKTGRVHYKNGEHGNSERESIVVRYANTAGAHLSRVHRSHVTPAIHHVHKTVIDKIIDVLKKVQKRFMRIKRSIEGKGVLTNNGKVSPFIKSISDHKKRNGNSNGGVSEN